MKLQIIMILLIIFSSNVCVVGLNPSKEILDSNTYQQNNSNFKTYEINVAVVYNPEVEYHEEIVQSYLQSLNINTNIKVIPYDQINLETLKNYDLVYPDPGSVYKLSEENINDIMTYVMEGGNLFLEEEFSQIFPKNFLGMSRISKIKLTNQTFTFPIVPEKYQNLQKLWKAYSIKNAEPSLLYSILKPLYSLLINETSSDIYDIDLTKVDIKYGAVPDTAISLVNSGEFTIFSINKYGNGSVLWTINHIPKRGLYFDKPFISRLDLGFPDPNAKNFNFGYATVNYLIRNSYLDYVAKEKYGFSISKVIGVYGRPSISWQNDFENLNGWRKDRMIEWIDILREQNQIPTFTVARGTYEWGTFYGTLILLTNIGTDREPIFGLKDIYSPYIFTGTRLKMMNNEFINVGKEAIPFVVDWNEDGKKDLIVGSDKGEIYYYGNVGENNNPVFSKATAIQINSTEINHGNTHPFVVDWNEDGKKDLIVGSDKGEIYYYENVGENNSPVFSKATAIQVNNTKVNVGGSAYPFVVDWNEDGKKDLIVGTSEYGPAYAINSPFIKTDVLRNINYAINHSVIITPHLSVDYNYTHEDELNELDLHKQTFEDMGIPWENGTTHHGFNAHGTPVWQTINSEMEYGLNYDFAWEAMAGDFEDLIPTSKPYMPYGMPFLLINKDHEFSPFIIWTPNPLTDYKDMNGNSGLFSFPLQFDLPINYIYHPEEAIGQSRILYVLSYIKYIIEYNAIPNFDLRYGATTYKIIDDFNRIRENYEYNFVAHDQAAKSIINTHYSKVDARIYGDKLVLDPNISDVPEIAKEYKNTLGIKIELSPDFKSEGISTDGLIYHKKEKNEIYLGLYQKTNISLNDNKSETFHLIRSNVPLKLNYFGTGYSIMFNSPGLRQFKIYTPSEMIIEHKKNIDIKRRGNYYEITNFGNSYEIINVTEPVSVLVK